MDLAELDSGLSKELDKDSYYKKIEKAPLIRAANLLHTK
jgi:hypothetical protein